MTASDDDVKTVAGETLDFDDDSLRGEEEHAIFFSLQLSVPYTPCVSAAILDYQNVGELFHSSTFCEIKMASYFPFNNWELI